MDTIAIPGKFIPAIGKLFADSETLTFTSDAQRFSIDDGSVFYRGKLMNDPYPDWRRIIPVTTQSSRVDVATLMQCVGRISAIAEDATKSGKYVPMRMALADTEIELTAKNRDGEESADYCEVERLSGVDYACAFAASKLLTALKSFGEIDNVELHYGETIGPMLFKRSLADREDFRLVAALLG